MLTFFDMTLKLISLDVSRKGENKNVMQTLIIKKIAKIVCSVKTNGMCAGLSHVSKPGKYFSNKGVCRMSI